MKTKFFQFLSRTDIILSIVLIIGLSALYYKILVDLVDTWSTNDNYSHGFFIPVISLYMIYISRSKLSNATIHPANWGLLVLIVGFCLLLVAKTGSEFFLQRASIIPVLLGIFIFILGSTYTKILLLPICYLFFMIPLPAIIWNKIAFPMQLFSTGLTEQVVQFIGIPVFREGNVLHLAETSLEVVDACSGLRSLTTMFALSAALAGISDFSLLKKWLIFLFAMPIAILSNIIRLSVTSILASKYGPSIAQGFLHEFSGFFTFFLGLIMLLAVYSAMRSYQSNQQLNLK